MRNTKRFKRANYNQLMRLERMADEPRKPMVPPIVGEILRAYALLLEVNPEKHAATVAKDLRELADDMTGGQQ